MINLYPEKGYRSHSPEEAPHLIGEHLLAYWAKPGTAILWSHTHRRCCRGWVQRDSDSNQWSDGPVLIYWN